ncbi:hypothetical protein BC940DRAFT_308436 [Gongronella butleri]|nr:hypothetical protein BC940DRAFT_308436 [Gongronella butleri]
MSPPSNNNKVPSAGLDLSALKDNAQLQQLLLMTLATLNSNNSNTLGQQPPQPSANHDNSSSSSNASSPESTTGVDLEKRKHDQVEEVDSNTLDKPTKSGRKPLTEDEIRAQNESDPKSKRKLQNRQAQRAFRERRLNYVKELEDRIKELESNQGQQSDKLVEENKRLRDVIQQLQVENAILGGAASSFDVPLSHMSTERPQKLQRSIATDNHQKNNINNNNNKHTSSTTTPPAFTSSPDDHLSLALSDSPPSVSSGSNKSMSHTPDTTVDDLFASTVPTDIFSNFESHRLFDQPIFDALDAAQIPLPKLEDTSDIFASVVNVDGADAVPQPQPQLQLALQQNTTCQQTDPHEKLPCQMTVSEVWDKVTAHPQFEEFDIDLLCSEMKNKAVCSETQNDKMMESINKYYPTTNMR